MTNEFTTGKSIEEIIEKNNNYERHNIGIIDPRA